MVDFRRRFNKVNFLKRVSSFSQATNSLHLDNRLPMVFSRRLASGHVINERASQLIKLRLFIRVNHHRRGHSTLRCGVTSARRIVHIMAIPSRRSRHLVPIRRILQHFSEGRIGHAMENKDGPAFQPTTVRSVIQVRSVRRVRALTYLVRLPFVALLQPRTTAARQLPNIIAPLSRNGVTSRITATKVHFRRVRRLVLNGRIFLTKGKVAIIRVFIHPRNLFHVRVKEAIRVDGNRQRVRTRKIFQVNGQP